MSKKKVKRSKAKAKAKPKAKRNKALEPIDIYGNWKVEDLTFEAPVSPFGLAKGGRSKFKIKNSESGHVLIKKKGVAWNDDEPDVVLTEVQAGGNDEVLFNANLRLKGMVTFAGSQYEVSFGSDDNGASLKIQAVGTDLQNHPGGTGTGARGGG